MTAKEVGVQVQQPLIILKARHHLKFPPIIKVEEQTVARRLHIGDMAHIQPAPYPVDLQGQKLLLLLKLLPNEVNEQGEVFLPVQGGGEIAHRLQGIAKYGVTLAVAEEHQAAVGHGLHQPQQLVLGVSASLGIIEEHIEGEVGRPLQQGVIGVKAFQFQVQAGGGIELLHRLPLFLQQSRPGAIQSDLHRFSLLPKIRLSGKGSFALAVRPSLL
jgi:hypothetical protein